MKNTLVRIGFVVAFLFPIFSLQAGDSAFRLSGPYVHLNLEIFLVHGPERTKAQKYVTLAEAMQRKIAVVHETSSVQQLAVENMSPNVAVFISAGDIVKGGRQDRVLSYDVIIPPKSGKVPLSSFCVESGRWAQRGKEKSGKFSASNNMVSSRSLKIATRRSRNQGKVWAEVANTQNKLNDNLRRMKGDAKLDVRSKKSATSMELTLENKELAQTTEDYLKKLNSILKGKTDVIGFVFLVNGELNNADIYGQGDLFEALWPKLLKSAVVEAISEFKSPGTPDPMGLITKHMQTINSIAEMFSAAAAGKPESKDVNVRTRLVTRETVKHLLFETQDKKLAKAWVHRTYINKPPNTPKTRSPAARPGERSYPQQQRIDRQRSNQLPAPGTRR